MQEEIGIKAVKAPVQTVASMEAELKELELQTARLILRERTANLQDVEERLAEREMIRDVKRQRSYTNGQTLRQLAAADHATQRRCNHRKGGNGVNGILGGQGDDSQFAVCSHMFCNGDRWLKCMRCGKTWKPVMPHWFDTKEEYNTVMAEYNAALNFQTRNVPSSSYVFKFSDGGDYYRDVTRGTNLR